MDGSMFRGMDKVINGLVFWAGMGMLLTVFLGAVGFGFLIYELFIHLSWS